MSQSTMVPTGVRHREQNDESRTVSEAAAVENLFDVLDDADCCSILRATSEEALSASELSEACDIPLSTTYRKLESLTEAGLLEEDLRLRRSSKHTSEYRHVDDIVVSMAAPADSEHRTMGQSSGSANFTVARIPETMCYVHRPPGAPSC